MLGCAVSDVGGIGAVGAVVESLLHAAAATHTAATATRERREVVLMVVAGVGAPAEKGVLSTRISGGSFASCRPSRASGSARM
jgi:hypothetical protein